MADDKPQLPEQQQANELAALAGSITQMYAAYVAAGMPPMVVAVMLGQWMAGLGQQSGSGA